MSFQSKNSNLEDLVKIMNIKKGMLINKVYEVTKEIHKSVNSSIYRAFDNKADRYVIVKFLEKKSDDPVNSELFRREVRSLENIDSQFVIRLIDYGEEVNFYYIVMEQLKGSQTLETYLYEENDNISIHDKLILFRKILLGMEKSHDIGVYHRDLNPTNILVNEDELKIIDFGISKITKFIYEEKITVSNHYTLGFASPEQLNGENVDGASDIFSLGSILYYMLLLESPSTIFEERMKTIASTSLPDKIIDIIRKCTEPLIENRYKSVRAIINDLDFFLLSNESKNESLYIKVTSTTINQLFSLGKILLQREDLAVKYLIKNLKEPYIYQGRRNDCYTLIGDKMSYYCDLNIQRSLIKIISCDIIDNYSQLIRERKKGIRIYAKICPETIEVALEKSEYLSNLIKQVNQESERYRENQKNSRDEMKLMELWSKTLRTQDKMIEKNLNIGSYSKLDYIPESNTIELHADQIDSYEKIEPGVEISVRKKKSTDRSCLGIVDDINPEESVITLIPIEYFSIDDFARQGPFGIDVTGNKIHNDRYKWALDKLKYRKSENKRLLDILINPNEAKYDEVSLIEPTNNKIDPSNIKVVEKALAARDIFLIQGPPGTGKTTVIEEIINQMMIKNDNPKILIASQSHVAVDNILKKVVEKYDVNQIVRLGDSSKISEDSQANKVKEQTKGWTELIKHNSIKFARPLLERLAEPATFPFEEIFENEISQTEAGDFNQGALFSAKQFLEESPNTRLKEYTSILKDWYHKLNSQEQFDDLLVSRANIVCSTCTGAANLGWVTNNVFDCVIIDEAAKSTFPEVLIPTVRGKKIILVGDHKQLPPIVNNLDDGSKQEKLLEKSLFEELFEKTNNPNIAVSLTKQFRMHPNISRMIKTIFYSENILESGVAADERTNFSRWHDKSIVWLSTSLKKEREETVSESKAYSNMTEALIINNELKDLNERYKDENANVKVGVISGYNGQKSLLRKIIKPESPQWTNLEISIENVDAYQGSEVDIVFYSVVRSNQKKQLGFLKDNRRLNVSLSRAMSLLVIVGDDMFLEGVAIKEHNYFRDLLGYIERFPVECFKEDTR